MLWYLHLCATGGVEVIAYDDDASGTMEEAGETGGRFIEVTLTADGDGRGCEPGAQSARPARTGAR